MKKSEHKKEVLYFYLNAGAGPSGAETRLVRTAALHSEYNDVVIYMREALREGVIRKGIGFGRADVQVFGEQFLFKKHKHFLLLSILMLAVRLFLSRKNYVVHVSILNPLLAIVFCMCSRRVIYEITSPDVADFYMRSIVPSLIKRVSFFRRRFTLLAVSESVEVRIRKGASFIGELQVRKLPYVEVSTELQKGVSKQNKVVFAHRLIQRKNPLLAVSAFERLARRYPDWTFEICGSGAMAEEVEGRIKAGTLSNLVFKGYVATLPQYLLNSKIFVSLIEPDNYPSQSVLAAMAAGNAICISNTGLSQEKFIAGNGTTCELNSESVEQSIATIIDGDLPLFMAASQRLVEDRYTLAAYMREHMTIVSGKNSQ